MAVMKEKTWERHANPISGFTRIITYPFVYIPLWFLAEFLEDPLTHWYVAVLGILVIIWFAVNPRLFKKPANFHHYMSRGVLGEKLWTEDRKKDTFATTLSVLTAPFFFISLYTSYLQFFWETMFFATVPFLLKLWFIDRMVFLYDHEKSQDCSDHLHQKQLSILLLQFPSKKQYIP